MILVSVGTMLPFDRLIQTMDAWAAAHPGEKLFAQIGAGAYEPKHMEWVRLIGPKDFGAKVRAANLIVAHAGMGSYLSAMEAAKPIVMLARLAALREHTTDHQVHTSRWLREKSGVYLAESDTDLPAAIERARAQGVGTIRDFQPYAPEPFLREVRALLLG